MTKDMQQATAEQCPRKTAKPYDTVKYMRYQVVLSDEAFKELKWMFKMAYKEKPGWLRKSYVTHQRKTKLIRDFLEDSGLGSSWCPYNTLDNWADTLHEVWHRLTEVS